MKKLLISTILLFIGTALGQDATNVLTGLAQPPLPFNILSQTGFENGTTGWSVTGGVFTATSVAADVARGRYSAKWTLPASTAAGVLFQSSAISVPVGLYGHDCRVQMLYRGNGVSNQASGAMSLESYDGTNILGATSLADVSLYTYIQTATFTCPSSGTIRVRIRNTQTTIASPTAMYFDEFVLADVGALNIGTAVTGVGTFGSVPNTAGLSIAASTLTMQPADGTHPGGVSTGAQTIPGAKTFSSAPTVTGLTSGPVINTAGLLSSEAQLAIARGGTGAATAPAAITALSPQTTKGDLLAYSSLPARLPVGTDGQVLEADSSSATGLKWFTTGAGVGDVVGPSSSVDSEVALFSGTTGKLLKRASGTGIAHLSSGVQSASNIVNADVDAAAAIAYSKLALSNSIVNADVNSSAAIALSKLASVTANSVVVSNGSGVQIASPEMTVDNGASGNLAITTSNASPDIEVIGTLTTSAATGLPTGVKGVVNSSGSGSQQPIGVFGFANLSGTTSGQADGGFFQVTNSGTAGTIYGLRTNFSNSGSATNAYGIAATKATGTVSGDNYAIFMSSGTMKGSDFTASQPLVTDSNKALVSQSYTTFTSNLSTMVGDSGSGGTKGLVPAPSTGDATKVLSGAGTWVTNGAGSVTSVGLSVPGSSLFSVTGTPVTSSGTLGLVTTGTSGGIPYFNSSSTMNTSAALTQHALILGGGAGAAPVALGSLGTTSQFLKGNASGDPSFSSVSLSTDVSGTLQAAQFPALTGDVTTSAGSLATTIANLAVTNAKIANSTIDVTSKITGITPIPNGGTGVSSVTTAPAITSFAGWDANKNLSANNHLPALTSTATAAGTTSLTVSSTYHQIFTGSSTQTVTLPVASTLTSGQGYFIVNNSTGVVTVQTSGANTIQAMGANTTLAVTCINSAGGTGTASWAWYYLPSTGGPGGAVSPTVQKFTSSSGTYTTPANVIYIRVRMVGGGGGGADSATSGGGNGVAGGNTTFGSSLLVANGGNPGAFGAAGGTGGTASLGSGPIGTALSGAQGGSQNSTSAAAALAGAWGASTPFGGGGTGGQPAGNGISAPANTGAGGGGGSCGNVSSCQIGSGGGAGGYVDAIITSPSATYSYAVGAAGTGGTGGGANGHSGGNGGAGYIEVTEYYANGAVGTATNITGTTNSTLTSLDATAGTAIHGTNTNNSASAGYLGEYIESVISSNVSFGTSSTVDDLTSISLTAGDWDVTAHMTATANGGTVTDVFLGISTTSGNSTTGLDWATNACSMATPVSAGHDTSGTVANFRVSLSGTTTYYLKRRAIFTVATPKSIGRLSARRVR